MTIASAGKFVWFDCVAPDTAKAAGFYGELFNWKTRDIPFGGGVTYTMLSVGEDGIGGILKTPNVHVAGEDIPGIGRIGIFSDPQGGMLGVLQPAPGM